MEWKKEWNGKRVFVKLKTGAVYSGDILDVDDELKPIIFITMRDKFGETVCFINSEIIKIKQETL